MPIVTSTYWNLVYGMKAEEAQKDKEGICTMKNIAKNMAWLLRCINEGKKSNTIAPKIEF